MEKTELRFFFTLLVGGGPEACYTYQAGASTVCTNYWNNFFYFLFIICACARNWAYFVLVLYSAAFVLPTSRICLCNESKLL